MSIHDSARNGTLVGDTLDKYMKSNPSILKEKDPSSGLVPLATAVVEGFPEEVKELLARGADANAVSRDDEPPLLLAAWKAKKERALIIQLLLEKILPGTVDQTCSAAEGKTPLIFVVEKKDIESIQLLVKAGAALQTKSGLNAVTAAKKDTFVIKALDRSKPSVLEELTKRVLDLLLYIASWANNTFNMVVEKVFRLNPKMNKEMDGLETTLNYEMDPSGELFLENIEHHLEDPDNSMLKWFFKGNEDFIKKFTQKMIDLKNDSTTALSEKDVLKKMIKVSLYKQVIYCDDSTSMKWNGRWESQKELAKRIASITTRILPDGEGVALRFINRDIVNSDNLTAEGLGQILDPMSWQPGGDTPIGTGLEAKVLRPMVYDKIKQGQLDRPLLVVITTDGMPEPESKSKIVDVILECRKKLEAASFPVGTVKFMIGQIGTANKATEFLDYLRGNQSLKETVYVTSDKLDEKFADLKANERGLDRWLVETLFSPFQVE